MTSLSKNSNMAAYTPQPPIRYLSDEMRVIQL
jgi:hypothetical protein